MSRVGDTPLSRAAPSVDSTNTRRVCWTDSTSTVEWHGIWKDGVVIGSCNHGFTLPLGVVSNVCPYLSSTRAPRGTAPPHSVARNLALERARAD